MSKKTSVSSHVIVLHTMIIPSMKSKVTSTNDSIEKSIKGHVVRAVFFKYEKEDGSAEFLECSYRSCCDSRKYFSCMLGAKSVI